MGIMVDLHALSYYLPFQNKCLNVLLYCMTGRAICGGILLFEAGSISPTEWRDDTEAENGISPVLPDPMNCNNGSMTRVVLGKGAAPSSCDMVSYCMGY